MLNDLNGVVDAQLLGKHEESGEQTATVRIALYTEGMNVRLVSL